MSCPIKSAFYHIPDPTEQPKKGRKRIYGRRVHIEHWTYTDVEVPGFERPLSVAHHKVRTRMCPEPVHLVVRTRPKKRKTLSLLCGLHHRSESIGRSYPPLLQIEVGL